MRIRYNSLYLPAYSSDLYRPDLINEESFVAWEKFHNWVINSSTEVVTNSVFDFIDDLIRNRKGYLGSGMHYMFWFYGEDHYQAFIKQVEEIFGVKWTGEHWSQSCES